ncbi:MAG: hypothetical protein NVS2B6_08410 [Thermoleophilaceae bacterium]
MDEGHMHDPRGRRSKATAHMPIGRLISVGLIALILVFAAVVTGCGKSSSSSSSQSSAQSSSSSGGSSDQPPAKKTHFAKTKFVIHAGLAFGAFHRYIYKPFRAGGFTPPLRHKAALVKGGIAALFAYHEIKVALHDAQSSPLLRKLVSPLTALQTRLRTMASSLRRGKLDSGDITSANRDTTAISAESAGKGQPITDQPTPSLGG